MGNAQNVSDSIITQDLGAENEVSEEHFKLNYRLLSAIDCGANGQVLKYECSGKCYAVKEMKFSQNGSNPMQSGHIRLSDIMNEIKVLQYVNNLEPNLPYFVKYYGFSVFSGGKIALIYELADGNLSELIENNFKGLKQEDLFSEYINLLITLVKALTFLELHNVAHRDMKPQNVLYRAEKDGRYSYILCDFGISKLCDLGTQNFNTTGGSPIFMSPEVTFNFYNQIEKAATNPFKSDVYSLGLLLIKTFLNKNLSSKERMVEKDFDPSALDAGPNDMKIAQLIEETYEYLLKISPQKFKINKLRIILKHMLMYNTKCRPDIFGIYSFLMNMGFIKSYEEIDRWVRLKYIQEDSKQINQLLKQNELLSQENKRLKTENDALKFEISKNEFLEKSPPLLKPFSSEKNFQNLEKKFDLTSSAGSPNSNSYNFKRSYELPPAIGFVIAEYEGRTRNIGGKYLVFLDKKIGKGSFGDIYLGSDTLGVTLFAIKERRLNSKFASTKEKFSELLRREVGNAKLLMDHPNIVSFVDLIHEENEVYVVCEYCQEGSLSYQLQKQNGKMEEAHVLRILKDIIEGFKLLHKNNIIHRNLKPSSILLNNGTAKLTGFYFSKHVVDADKKQLMTSFGTPQYLAPEIFESKEYSSKCDVWSLGITLFEMLYGDYPWRGKTTHDLIENNIKKKNLVFPQSPFVSKEMRDLIGRMLVFDQDNRISWNEIFALDL